MNSTNVQDCSVPDAQGEVGCYLHLFLFATSSFVSPWPGTARPAGIMQTGSPEGICGCLHIQYSTGHWLQWAARVCTFVCGW